MGEDGVVVSIGKICLRYRRLCRSMGSMGVAVVFEGGSYFGGVLLQYEAGGYVDGVGGYPLDCTGWECEQKE